MSFLPDGHAKGLNPIKETIMRVGDKLAELLVKNGVKYVYGVPGGQSLPLYEGIRKLQDQIQHVADAG